MSQGPNTSSKRKFHRFSPCWSILSRRQRINPTLIAQKATFCWYGKKQEKLGRIRLKVPTFPHATTPDLAGLPKKLAKKKFPPRSVLLCAPWKLNKLSRRSMNVWMRISSSNHLEYYLFGIEFPFFSRNWNFSDLFSENTRSVHRRVHIFVWIWISPFLCWADGKSRKSFHSFLHANFSPQCIMHFVKKFVYKFVQLLISHSVWKSVLKLSEVLQF